MTASAFRQPMDSMSGTTMMGTSTPAALLAANTTPSAVPICRSKTRATTTFMQAEAPDAATPRRKPIT